MSPSFCCVTSEKTSGTDRFQLSTSCACGRVTKGHRSIPSLWTSMLIDYLSYIVPLCCQPKPSSAALSLHSLSQSAGTEHLRGGAEVIVSGVRLPGAHSPLTCLYLCLHICATGQCRELSQQETTLHLRCYHHTLKYPRASTPSLMVL